MVLRKTSENMVHGSAKISKSLKIKRFRYIDNFVESSQNTHISLTKIT